jgi:hypothetical protein
MGDPMLQVNEGQKIAIIIYYMSKLNGYDIAMARVEDRLVLSMDILRDLLLPTALALEKKKPDRVMFNGKGKGKGTIKWKGKKDDKKEDKSQIICPYHQRGYCRKGKVCDMKHGKVEKEGKKEDGMQTSDKPTTNSYTCNYCGDSHKTNNCKAKKEGSRAAREKVVEGKEGMKEGKNLLVLQAILAPRTHSHQPLQ